MQIDENINPFNWKYNAQILSVTRRTLINENNHFT